MALSQLRASVVKAAPLRQTIKHYACASMPIRELHAAIVRPPSSRMVDAISSVSTVQSGVPICLSSILLFLSQAQLK